MIHPQYILKSKKKIGKYEEVIIGQLSEFFTKDGFHVIPHARFDLAWGSILSDVDLLLIKNDTLILIEVKSSKDNLERAKKQISRIEDFVDLAYLATDYKPKKWPSNRAGRILVLDGNVTILKEPKPLKSIPKINTLMRLKKESLLLLLGESKSKNQTKYELATQIIKKNHINLKNQIKEIVTCQKHASLDF